MHLRPELQRARECPLRRPKSCGDIDTSIGFVAMLEMPRCNECWNAGGARSANAVPIRLRIAREIVQEKIDRGLEHYQRHVQLAILNIMEPEEAAAAKKRIDDFNARPKKEVTTRWLGMTWIGEEPFPKRIWPATTAAGKAFVRRLRNCKGCGCNKRLKDAARSVKSYISGGTAPTANPSAEGTPKRSNDRIDSLV